MGRRKRSESEQDINIIYQLKCVLDIGEDCDVRFLSRETATVSKNLALMTLIKLSQIRASGQQEIVTRMIQTYDLLTQELVLLDIDTDLISGGLCLKSTPCSK